MWCHMISRDNLLWSPLRFHVMPHHLEHDVTWSDITCSLVWSNLCTYLICVMTSHDLIWPHMTSYDFVSLHMISYDVMWRHLISSHWSHTISHGLVWALSYAPMWSHTVSYGPMWVYRVLFKKLTFSYAVILCIISHDFLHDCMYTPAHKGKISCDLMQSHVNSCNLI